MKPLVLVLLSGLAALAQPTRAQSLDFQNTPYFTAVGATLTASGQTLAGFSYDNVPAGHPLVNAGAYFPVVDFQGRNLWVRVRHIGVDPNGPTVGYNVTATAGDPFRAGLGGWWGFVYEFVIYADAAVNGLPSNSLAGVYPTNVTVESLETLSAGELVTFEILNPQASSWVLNSVNFTGLNPGSTPGFSAVSIPWPGSQPPAGFSTTFPAASRNVYVVDYGGGGSYAEFRMSANRVSSFLYGYEYPDAGGYQGMNLIFGAASATGVAENAAAALQLTASPTVTAEAATIRYTLPRPETVTLYLTDALGRRRLLRTVAQAAGDQQVPVSLAAEAAGNYWLTVHTSAGAATTRLLKQ